MITKQEIKEHIEGYCKELRLPAIRQSFEEDAREADLKNYADLREQVEFINSCPWHLTAFCIPVCSS
jgi:hypothetical protein